jgi:hypothetical protein
MTTDRLEQSLTEARYQAKDRVNKVGLDVALESRREGGSKRKFTIEELPGYAEVHYVKNVM